MRCPKCGKVLAKTNDGSYVCTPDCKYVFDSCKTAKNSNKLNDMIDEFVHNYGSIFQNVVKNSMRNDLQKIVIEAKKLV
jgi:phage FluMu protein Com